MTELKRLRLLGKVKGSNIPNTFFADYAEQELIPHRLYAVMKINEVVIEREGVGYYLTIRRIREQTGQKLSFVPEGWKTIITLQWEGMPIQVMQLPQMDHWDYNEAAVNLELREIPG